jgi:hypothetical protein
MDLGLSAYYARINVSLAKRKVTYARRARVATITGSMNQPQSINVRA